MRVALAVAAFLTVVSCAARRPFVRPVEPGGPAPDASSAWQEATEACRSTPAYRGALGITGRVGDQRVRGLASARLFAAVTAAGDIGLEAYVSTELVFKLGGGRDAAVLLLRDGNRVVTAPPEDILEALIGVRLTPTRLLAILTGCVSSATSIDRAAAHGEIIEAVTPDATLFLERRNGVWRVRAGYFDTLTVDYWAFESRLPRELTVRSRPGHEPGVSLLMKVQDVNMSADIDRSAFTVNLPDTAPRISLDELRESGPLGGQPPKK